MEELEFLYYLLVTEDDLAYYGWSDISAYLGNELMDGRELTAFEANLAGVIAYIDGNDGTATQYFEEASEKAPLSMSHGPICIGFRMITITNPKSHCLTKPCALLGQSGSPLLEEASIGNGSTH